jgi:hypothetical protein
VLRDYGALGTVRHPWPVTVLSALLGAVSHLGWDAVTHPTVDGGRIVFPALLREVVPGLPWWYLVRRVSDLAGFAAGVALVGLLGRARLVRRWHGAPPVVPRHPAAFWSVFSVVLVGGLVTLPVQPVRQFNDQAVRCMLLTGLALVAGAVAARIAARTVMAVGAGRCRRGARWR